MYDDEDDDDDDFDDNNDVMDNGISHKTDP